MKTYLDMDEILRHCRRCTGQDYYGEPYLVSAVPEEVIRSLPPADVAEVRHGYYICRTDEFGRLKMICSVCKEETGMSYRAKKEHLRYCPDCGAKMDGGRDDASNT